MNKPFSQLDDDIPFGVEEEVDLIEYLNAILRYKYRILIVAMLGAVGVFGAAQLVSDIYVSTAVVAVNIKEKQGGVSPKEYRASDALGLIEHDFIIEGAHANEKDRLLARMQSMKFSSIFIEENNLLPYIFHKKWDVEKEQWVEDFVPDKREAAKVFGETMRGIENDEETGLLRVNFKMRNPKQAAELANKFVLRFNEYIRDNQAAILKARRDYLEQRLKQVENLELHKSIFRLMETQLAAESLLYARTEYPLEMIQPAFPAIYKAYPSRKKWAALTMVALSMLGIMVAIGVVIIGKIRDELKSYQQKMPQKANAISDESGKASTRKLPAKKTGGEKGEKKGLFGKKLLGKRKASGKDANKASESRKPEQRRQADDRSIRNNGQVAKEQAALSPQQREQQRAKQQWAEQNRAKQAQLPTRNRPPANAQVRAEVTGRRRPPQQKGQRPPGAQQGRPQGSRQGSPKGAPQGSPQGQARRQGQAHDKGAAQQRPMQRPPGQKPPAQQSSAQQQGGKRPGYKGEDWIKK